MKKQPNQTRAIARRDFLKLSAASMGAAGSLSLAATAEAGANRAESPAAAKSPRTKRSRTYLEKLSGARLNRVAFPMGGMGAGMICLEGTGALSHISLRHRPEVFNEPITFGALCVKGDPNVARVLEGPVPDWKKFGQHGSGNGASGATYGLPRFRTASFQARFPFATVDLSDRDLPFDVQITGWSPFEPGDADHMSLPVAALEYRFTNRTNRAREAVFSWSAKNFMAVGKNASAVKATAWVTADRW